MSERTIKLPYLPESQIEHSRIVEWIDNYNHLLRFDVQRAQEYYKENGKKPSTEYLLKKNKEMNNIFVDSLFKNSAIYEAKAMCKKEKIIFGGRKNFISRCQGKMSKEEWQELKRVPLYSVGEANQKGNRKFQILSENKILFKPNSQEHFILTLPNLRKNIKQDILKLMSLQNTKEIPISYKLDKDNIYISFENDLVQEINFAKDKIQDRIFAIDMNPNYIGWSVVDWLSSEEYKLIDSGVISNKLLNDNATSLDGKGIPKDDPRKKHIVNKRKYENLDSANFLVSKALHYQCSHFVIEDLNFKKDEKSRNKGKNLNKLCNEQWSRVSFTNQLKKECSLAKVNFQEVLANYSSFIGNLVYRRENLPDMCLASIEIGRRGYEFYHQYIIKDKELSKNIVIDNSEKSHHLIEQSLEELGFEGDKSVSAYELYPQIKSRKIKYRVPIGESCFKDKKSVSSKKSINSLIFLYNLK